MNLKLYRDTANAMKLANIRVKTSAGTTISIVTQKCRAISPCLKAPVKLDSINFFGHVKMPFLDVSPYGRKAT